MRSDMAKVIVTRPRVNNGYGSKGRKPRDPEDAPVVERIRTKQLNENLAPLKRYLRSQVGKRWDDVWSDISALLRPTSTIQQHVRDHVFDYVAKDLLEHEGEVYQPNGRPIVGPTMSFGSTRVPAYFARIDSTRVGIGARGNVGCDNRKTSVNA